MQGCTYVAMTWMSKSDVSISTRCEFCIFFRIASSIKYWFRLSAACTFSLYELKKRVRKENRPRCHDLRLFIMLVIPVKMGIQSILDIIIFLNFLFRLYDELLLVAHPTRSNQERGCSNIASYGFPHSFMIF